MELKRKVLLAGFGTAVLAGSGAAWISWQHKEAAERVKSAEIKRLAAQAEAEAAKAKAAAEAKEEAEKLRRTSEPPTDLAGGPHFAFSHFFKGRVGYEYSQDKRPPVYTHLLCDDGIMQAMSFDYGWIKPGNESYDFYKAPVVAGEYDKICLSLRKEDMSTYKTIPATPNPATDCSDTDQARIRSLAGRAKDTIRWCEFRGARDGYGFLQAVTKNNEVCEINSWLVTADRLLPIGLPYRGEYRTEEGSEKPASCIFPLADGDIPETDMIGHGGPIRSRLMFELGQKTYIVMESSGSEGSTSTLYRLDENKLEEIADYYNYMIDHNFWNSTGELSNP